MPKGQKLIDWTPENDARLMLTILALENIHPNCEAVASAFGGAVNAMAISNRLSRLRKKAADEGLLPKGGATTAPSNSKGGKSNGRGKKGKAAGKKADELLGAEGSESETLASCLASSPRSRKDAVKKDKVLTGRVTKARNAAKENAKGIVEIVNGVKTELGDVELDGAGALEGKNESDDGEEDVAVHIKKEKEEEDD